MRMVIRSGVPVRVSSRRGAEKGFIDICSVERKMKETKKEEIQTTPVALWSSLGGEGISGNARRGTWPKRIEGDKDYPGSSGLPLDEDGGTE
jgi:hypothetical protein